MKDLRSREDLIKMVEQLLDCEGTEEEIDSLLSEIQNSVIDPSICDYIYYDELTVEEIVDKALSYKPIIL